MTDKIRLSSQESAERTEGQLLFHTQMLCSLTALIAQHAGGPRLSELKELVTKDDISSSAMTKHQKAGHQFAKDMVSARLATFEEFFPEL